MNIAKNNLQAFINDRDAQIVNRKSIVINPYVRPMEEIEAEINCEITTVLDYVADLDSNTILKAKQIVSSGEQLALGAMSILIKDLLSERAEMIKAYLPLIDSTRDALALGNKEVHVEPEHQKVMLDLRLALAGSIKIFPGKYKS